MLDEFTVGNVDGDTAVTGCVEIGAGTTVDRSVIRGPVVIGERCSVRDSFIGPYAAIGDDSVIDHTTIQHSVFLDQGNLEHADRLEDRVLGRGVTIKTSANGRKALRVFVSDDSEITL